MPEPSRLLCGIFTHTGGIPHDFMCDCMSTVARGGSIVFHTQTQAVTLHGWHAHFNAKQKVSVWGHHIMSHGSVLNTSSMFPSQCRTKRSAPIQANTFQHHHLRRKEIFVISCLSSTVSWEGGFLIHLILAVMSNACHCPR